MITTNAVVVTTATTTVSTAITGTTTGASSVTSTATADSSVTTTTSTASTATVNVTSSNTTFTNSSTATIMNTSTASASTLTLIDVADIKPDLREASTTATILNTTTPISEVNYAVTKSSSAKTTLSNLSTNKNTISVINISEQLEAGLENNSAHVNLIEQLSGSSSTPTQVFVQPVNNCPSRVVVHLDNAGQIIPLSVPIHFLDPNLQFFQSDPMQLIQTVTVPSQNVLNSYDNSTF